MFNLFNQKEKTNDINEKLKYRYTKTKQDLKDLEEVTDATLHSQYDALAKGTQQGISTMPRLKNAMLEEAELLTDASENYARLSLKARKQSDELKTRVKEAERFERKSNKKLSSCPSSQQMQKLTTKKKSPSILQPVILSINCSGFSLLDALAVLSLKQSGVLSQEGTTNQELA